MKANIIQDAWFVRGRVCDATVTAQLDGVTISIPGHSEVQVYLSANDLRQVMGCIDGALDGLKLSKHKREVIIQGGGITTKLATVKKLETDGLVTIHETAHGHRECVTKFDLDPARAHYAARYSLTDEGEKVLHLLSNGGAS